MDIYGAFILKEGIISHPLHNIRHKNNNFIYTTVPFYNQKGELPVLTGKYLYGQNVAFILIFKCVYTKKKNKCKEIIIKYNRLTY